MRSVFPCDKMACVDNAKELVVKQMKRRKRIFLVLAIIWMLVISAFSSRTGDLSATDSGRIGRLIGQVLVPGFEDWSEEKQDAMWVVTGQPMGYGAGAGLAAVAQNYQKFDDLVSPKDGLGPKETTETR